MPSSDELNLRIDQLRASGSLYPVAQMEIFRLEEKKTEWTQGLLLLLASFAAFLSSATQQQGWETMLWIIPVLFFHECGHWVAMKIFGYRNMRMFFIPYFGAAVSGQNRTIPGWKKAIVSLAGPVPGILLGALLCPLAIAYGGLSMRTCVLWLIILNVFNLIPLLPLDGGRFLYATLFCRNRWLDFSFRMIAIAGAIALAALGWGKALPIIAIALAAGLPMAYKYGNIIDSFRHDPISPPEPGETHISVASAEALIIAVKREFPKASNRLIARHVLNLYEMLNAHPPSGAATTGLMAAYCGAIALSVVCVVSMISASRGSFGKYWQFVRSAPRDQVSHDSMKFWRGPEVEPAQVAVVATLPDRLEAKSIFNSATNSLPPNAAALLFGESVIVELPDENLDITNQWYKKFRARSASLFIASNDAVKLTLSFESSTLDAATNLEDAINGYFRIRSEHLIPPWDPAFVRSSFDSQREARRFWNRIQSRVARATAAGLKADILNAVRTNEPAIEKTNRLNALRIRSLPFQDEERERLRSEYAASPYLPLLDLEGQLMHLDLTNSAERRPILDKIANKMGRNLSAASD
jgi:Zn-dependent protease